MKKPMKLVIVIVGVVLMSYPASGAFATEGFDFEDTVLTDAEVSDDGISDADFEDVLVKTVTILNTITTYMNGVVAQAQAAQSVEQVVALFDSIPGQIRQFRADLGKIGEGNTDAYSRRLQYSNDERLKNAIQGYQQANANFIFGLSSLSESIFYDPRVQAAMRRLKIALGM